MGVTQYFCEAAWLGGAAAARDVLVTVEGDRFAAVEAGARRPSDAVVLDGLSLPGFANVHSHAFHRALRGWAEGPGSFWTWRERMYAVAGVLDPASYRRLARAVYAEMVLAGFSAVGEFHYLHHAEGGRPYEDPNAMGRALLDAAADAGIRTTLLDACYLERGPGQPADGVQERFSDGDTTAWAARADALAADAGGRPGVRIGAAVHSLRAVAPPAVEAVATWAAARSVPLHVHVSEQPAENEAVIAAYGASPSALLARAGALGRGTTAVHATHLGAADVQVLGASGTTVGMCPTTERFLADGIGPAPALADAGCPLALGTDCHAVVDPFEEMRALELDERLASRQRGRFSAAALLEAATAAGHAALGWPDAGRLAPGAPADLVTVGLGSVRLAGAGLDHVLERVVFAAGAADVRHVVVGGCTVVQDGRHLVVGDVAGELAAAIGEVLGAAGGAAGGDSGARP